MKRIFIISIIVACMLFLLFGLVTILKGDVDGWKESAFMLGYLIAFSATGLIVYYAGLKKRRSIR